MKGIKHFSHSVGQNCFHFVWKPKYAMDPMKFPWVRSDVERFIREACDRNHFEIYELNVQPDHVHLLCDIVPDVHGEKVRRLVKRWLGQKLSERWPLPKEATWWAEEGSNIAIGNEDYLNNCFKYIFDQRATQ